MTSLVIILVAALLGMPQAAGTQAAAGTIEKGDFRFTYDDRGVSGLANPHDPFGATLMPTPTAGGGRGGRGGGGASATLGLNLSYRTGGGEWTNLTTRGAKWTASPETGTVTYASDAAGAPLKVVETYSTDGNVLDWTVDLESLARRRCRSAISASASRHPGPPEKIRYRYSSEVSCGTSLFPGMDRSSTSCVRRGHLRFSW